MSARSLILPLELVDLVAQHLINDFAFGTCAAINVVSKAIHKATLKTLWTTMYWIPFKDEASYDKEKIERKWKVFKGSKGVKHVRFMIEPFLFKTATGYGEQPIISKSLVKTLKASIALDPRGRSSKIQVFFFKGYGYNSTDFASVQDALNLAKSLQAFASITEIDAFVHAKPVNRAKVASPNANNGPATSTAIESKIPGDGFQQQTSDAIKDTNTGWLSFIFLDINKSAKLDENDHVTGVSHVVKLLQPYSERRIQDDSLEKPARLMMSALKVPAVLSFASAIVKLYDSSQFSAMVDYHLDLAYDEETGKPFPTRSQMSEMREFLQQAKNKLIRALKAVPLRMLGRFHISNHRETVYVDVRVQADRKVLETNFAYGFSEMDREEVRLADVGDAEA